MLIAVAGMETATALWIGLGLCVACLVVAGLLRMRWAYVLGWAIQVAAVAVGFQVADHVLRWAGSSCCCGARRTSWAARSTANARPGSA